MGAHQLDNAAAAVTAALALARDGFERITHAAILEGLNSAALPGRFQVNQGKGSTVWLDAEPAQNDVTARSRVNLRISKC